MNNFEEPKAFIEYSNDMHVFTKILMNTILTKKVRY